MSKEAVNQGDVRLCVPFDLRSELKIQAAKENRSMVGLIKDMLKDRKQDNPKNAE